MYLTRNFLVIQTYMIVVTTEGLCIPIVDPIFPKNVLMNFIFYTKLLTQYFYIDIIFNRKICYNCYYVEVEPLSC